MAPIEEIQFDRASGRYQWVDTKRYVSNDTVLSVLEDERQRLKVRLQSVTRLMIDQKIELSDWQLRVATLLKESHLRSAVLGAGGKEMMSSQIYGAVGFQLQQQYKFLDNFAQAIYRGEITPAKGLYRIGTYANSTKVSFNRANQIARGGDGFNEAKRMLDPQAQHCRSCLRYSTGGRWVPIGDVVAPGFDCECRQNCRCRVVYRRRPAKRSPLSSPLSQPGILAG